MKKTIINEEDFLKSFEEYQFKQAKKYFNAKKLDKEIKNFSEISRMIKCPNRTVSDWLNNKRKPIAINSLEYLKSINLIPLTESKNEKFVLFTELSSFLFGDGHLLKNSGGFKLFGQKKDLEKLKEKIKKTYNIDSEVYKHKTSSEVTKIRGKKIIKNKIKGTCEALAISSSPLARLLFVAGVPKGDKVKTLTKVPEWIIGGNKETKRIFLSVLFGNELESPNLRAKNAFTSPQFGLHKIERKQEKLKLFLKQIKELLKEFEISTSRIGTEKCKTVRKDGNLSNKAYFTINSHGPNILKLFKEIPFLYAEEKQKRFEKVMQKFVENSKPLEKEWDLYKKVIKMHENGKGRRTIFKELKLPKNYFHKINAWIHYGNKPLYFDKKEAFEQ